MDGERPAPHFDHYLAKLGTDRPLQVAVMGHLVIERLLEELIKTQLRCPCALDIDRLRFLQKVDLCIALGALPDRFRPACRRLNTLRNRFSHDLGYSVKFEETMAWADEVLAQGIGDCGPTVMEELKSAEETRDAELALIMIVGSLHEELVRRLADLGGPDYSW